MLLCLVLLFVAVLTLWLTGLLRRYALAHSLLDIPNARSSHTLPTPRGGGVAIVLGTLVVLPLLWWFGHLALAEFWALFGAGALVALVGWLDDHGHVAAGWRLLVHFMAASWSIALLGGFPPLLVFGHLMDFGWLGHGVAVFYLVWLLNLYNFMDGIDGLAGIEAISVCLGGALLYVVSSTDDLWLSPLVLMAAVIGFLFWNFPRARIFMGDAGSGFVGLLLGLFSLQAASLMPTLFWGWLILLGAFVVDATVTLVRRMLHGERIYEAHRTHAYQHAAIKLGSHIPVSLAFGAINIGWLLPIALLVALEWVDGVLGILIAYFPLFLLALRFRAGMPGHNANG